MRALLRLLLSAALIATSSASASAETPADSREQAAADDSWKIWLIGGTGVLLVGTGIVLEVLAHRDLNDYEEQVDTICPSGCFPEDLPGSVRDLKDRGILENRLGFTALILGSAGVITALTWSFVQDAPSTVGDGSLTLVPRIGSDMAGAALLGRF